MVVRRSTARVSRPVRVVRVWAALAVLSAAAVLGSGDALSQQEHWYGLELGGKPAGWMMLRETAYADRRVTESATQMTIARGGTPVRVETESRFVESVDGRPLEAWSKQRLGAQPIETDLLFRADHVLVKTRQGERENASRKPWPEGGFLTPAKAQEAVLAALRQNLQTFSVRSLDPLLGLQVVTTEWQRVVEPGESGASDVSTWQQRMSTTPGLVVTALLDANGTLLTSTTPFLGTELTLTLTDRETAQKESDPPELLARSFVFPNRPIVQPRALRRAVYRLRTPEGAPPIPSLGSQRATIEADATLVAVDLDGSPPGDRSGGDEAIYLRSSTFLDHHAPQIRALAKQATSGLDSAATTAVRAESLRRFVARYLDNKNLDATLATAVEVAESRAGDCTEHSVLLAALLRAEGIPSRVTTGLIYVDRFVGAENLFAFHMWTQAWSGDRWVDLDATLAMPFDAAHIALATSALDDDQAALIEMAAVLPWLGSIQIEVLETAGSGDD